MRIPLVLPLLAAVLWGGTALAGESRISLEIVGVVPETCELQIDGSDVTLDLAAPVREVRVATVTETCNRFGGYTVIVRSSRQGVLASDAGTIAYAVSYGGDRIDLAEGQALERDGPQQDVERDLLVTIPQGDHPAGLYEDVLTIEIAAH